MRRSAWRRARVRAGTIPDHASIRSTLRDIGSRPVSRKSLVLSDERGRGTPQPEPQCPREIRSARSRHQSVNLAHGCRAKIGIARARTSRWAQSVSNRSRLRRSLSVRAHGHEAAFRPAASASAVRPWWRSIARKWRCQTFSGCPAGFGDLISENWPLVDAERPELRRRDGATANCGAPHAKHRQLSRTCSTAFATTTLWYMLLYSLSSHLMPNAT